MTYWIQFIKKKNNNCNGFCPIVNSIAVEEIVELEYD